MTKKRISEKKFREWSKNVPATLRGGGRWPDSEGSLSQRIREQTGDEVRGTVKKSYTSDGARSLIGTMIHRAPKTLRGKGVVADKPDRTEG